MASALEYELQMKNLVQKGSETSSAQERSAESRNRTGLSFLKRPWTPVEILSTCVMFFEMFGWGLFHGLFGPTLLDLQLTTNTTTTEIGFMFTVITIGALVGAIAGGQILDRINCRLYMAIVLLFFGSMIIALPWATNFASLMALAVVLGIFEGALDCGKNTTALLLWGWDGAVLMQAYHCIFAIGTFVSPWIAAPFILPDLKDNSTEVENTTVASLDPKFQVTDTIRVQYSFLIVGVYFLVSSMAFSITYLVWVKHEELKDGRYHRAPVKTEKQIITKDSNFKLEPLGYRIPMMILMFFRFGTYVGLEVTFATFLMTFAVKGLNWSKQDGIVVTSVFRASFAAARGISIFLAAIVTPTKMILKDLLILISAFLVLLFCVEADKLVLWVGSGVVGFGMGSIYASSMSWVDGQMVITGKAGATFVTGTWIGVLTIPASVGYLFDTVGPFGFIYACLGDTVLLTFICGLAMLVAFVYHKKANNRNKPSKQTFNTKL